MLKIDIDHLKFWHTRFLLSLWKPYEIRVSSSGRGVHVRIDCSLYCRGCDMRQEQSYSCWIALMDDRHRLIINRDRFSKGLLNEIAWKLKKGEKAGEWERIETAQEFDRFLRKFTGFY